MKLSPLLIFAALLPFQCLSVGAEPSIAAPAESFHKNPAWTRVSAVSLPKGATELQATGTGSGDLLFCAGPKEGAPHLRSQAYLGDAIVHLKFIFGDHTAAGLYLQGRYRVELAGDRMGEVGPLANGAGPVGLATAPLVKPIAQAGVWHVLDAKFRAPRFDDARNKTQDALLLEVKIDGKLVQFDTIQKTWSQGADSAWDDAGGQTSIAVEHGSFALSEFSNALADFSAIKVPAISGQPTNTASLVDLVKQGEENFRGFGCIECHATQRNDLSAKTGPNLYGLFTEEPRERTIASGPEGHHFTIKADHAYLVRSVRTPQAELAIGERGPNTGKPYPPVMPTFAPSVLSDAQLDGIGAYLATLNDFPNRGPVVRLAEVTGLKNYNPMTDRLQMLVDRTVRIQRGPMPHVSARSIHVGLPNAINYTFDPRLLAIVQVWQGGFLDMSGEFLNRGGNGLKTGYNSVEIDLGASGVILAPLNAQEKPIDFSFKDAIFKDEEPVREALYSKRDQLDRLAEINAQFLGYSRDSTNPNAAPVFSYRVGENVIHVQTDFAADGETQITVSGDFAQEQSFAINDQVLKNLSVSGGNLTAGHWAIPAGKGEKFAAKGKLTVAEKPWHATPSSFNSRVQPLVVEPSTGTLPAGYRVERYMGPKDNYGRDLLFEALGVVVAPDGTIVVSTRTAGIWRLSHGEWSQFAEGLFDSLGVQVEDEHGFVVVAGQKAELTRISDTNGDGFADRYETLSDAFSYHGNYHSYMHGPVKDANGDYFITLNLNDSSGSKVEYRANGKYMGTSGGYRGWMIHVPAKGGFEPWANGLRSPAGLAFAPDGRLWYAENQGEYVGTSKLFVVKKGAFYGHPAGLVDLPGMTPDSPEIAWDKVWNKREAAVVLFPESRLANSPGNPAWDTTAGGFGPFAGQMFIGDQTQSLLMRVTTEKVEGVEQGVVVPFATDLESGIMRPVFLPDHSLILGETGRGWQAKGGHVASLQRLVWDGKTTPPVIATVTAAVGGFDVHLTVPVPAEVTDEQLASKVQIRSWVYRDAPDYGSPEMDDHDEILSRVITSPDRTVVHVTLANTAQPNLHPQQTARVYHLMVNGKDLWKNAGPGLDAFYTLYRFPAAAK